MKGLPKGRVSEGGYIRLARLRWIDIFHPSLTRCKMTELHPWSNSKIGFVPRPLTLQTPSGGPNSVDNEVWECLTTSAQVLSKLVSAHYKSDSPHYSRQKRALNGRIINWPSRVVKRAPLP